MSAYAIGLGDDLTSIYGVKPGLHSVWESTSYNTYRIYDPGQVM